MKCQKIIVCFLRHIFSTIEIELLGVHWNWRESIVFIESEKSIWPVKMSEVEKKDADTAESVPEENGTTEEVANNDEKTVNAKKSKKKNKKKPASKWCISIKS